MNLSDLCRLLGESSAPVAQEAVRFVQGTPQYTRVFSRRNDIEAQRHPIAPGEISTHLRYGSSVATRGRPDAYSHTQRIRPLRGLIGPVPAKQDLAGDDNQTTALHIYTAFRRPPDLDADLLNKVKQLGFDGADEMIDDAATYLASVVEFTHFDAVCPVPSSKPLAGKLAAKIAEILTLEVWPGNWKKVAVAKDTAVASRGSQEVFKYVSAAQDVPDNVLLVDDFVTTRQSLTELARKLYSQGARYVAAVALCGPAQVTARKSTTP